MTLHLGGNTSLASFWVSLGGSLGLYNVEFDGSTSPVKPSYLVYLAGTLAARGCSFRSLSLDTAGGVVMSVASTARLYVESSEFANNTGPIGTVITSTGGRWTAQEACG